MEKKYPNFYKETGYGTATGLCGINCRHSFHPYYKGSTRAYTQEQLNRFLGKKNIRKVVAYTRVSSRNQQDDLHNQMDFIINF